MEEEEEEGCGAVMRLERTDLDGCDLLLRLLIAAPFGYTENLQPLAVMVRFSCYLL
jgi:hypothetical protein